MRHQRFYYLEGPAAIVVVAEIWLPSFHQRLEQELKAYLGVSGLSLMVNGHMALELMIQAMGFPEGAEVITTPFTFISTI